MAYQDVQLPMPETRKETRACKDPIQRDQRLAKEACDSTGCVAVKATPEEPESRFCCFKQYHDGNENTTKTLLSELLFVKLARCLLIEAL